MNLRCSNNTIMKNTRTHREIQHRQYKEQEQSMTQQLQRPSVVGGEQVKPATSLDPGKRKIREGSVERMAKTRPKIIHQTTHVLSLFLLNNNILR
jgi:hypothetical protein